jgi:2-polyprenyl-3-methyl-5-hydroxy-6-metoxy-1,4-benzoquinol methylase
MSTISQTECVPCGLCGSKQFRPFLTKFGLPIVRCQSCGFVMANPRIGESEVRKRYSADYFFGEYLTTFKASNSSFSLDLVKDHYSLFLELLASSHPPGSTVLDIGCGAGFFLKAAESLGWEVSGTEISEAAAGYGRSVTKVRVYLGNLEAQSLPSESTAAVTMLDILEHLSDPLRTLREAHRILKEGGMLIISTPDFDSLSRLFLGPGWAVLSPAEHLSYFTESTLFRALGETGFRVVKMRNLLNFNPDYTHRPESVRSRLWKTVYQTLERSRLTNKARQYEYRELVSPGRIETGITAGGFDSSLRKRIFGRAKSWLRGDTLVAVATKPQAPDTTS